MAVIDFLWSSEALTVFKIGSKCEPNAPSAELFVPTLIVMLELNEAVAPGPDILADSAFASFFSCAWAVIARSNANDTNAVMLLVFMTIDEKPRFPKTPFPPPYKSLDVNVLLTFPIESRMI